jgi:hypothetical protein
VRFEPARIFRIALAASLTISTILFFLWSWRWPLLGDASLIHYIGFLITRGWAPYRDLGDMNMPGSYLIEIAAMHLFGMGSLAWRCFDFTLLLAASAAFYAVTKEPGAPSKLRLGGSTTSKSPWLPALFAASLFILIHGRDGLSEGGQRDLTMAVCLLAATAFLFIAIRRNSAWPAAAFGLLAGIALTIKPTALPLSLAQLALATLALHRRNPKARSIASRLIVPATLAALIGPAIAIVFLVREQTIPAFLAGFHGIVPYYASLGHRPVSFVLMHSISPLLPLVIAWLVVLALSRPHLDWERAALFTGVLFGFLNCIAQQRALPYYRYPLLAFLLPLMAIDFTRAFNPATESGAPSKLRLGGSATTDPGAPFVTAPSSRVGSATRCAQILSTLALAFAAFFLAPQSAILIHRYQWDNTEFITSLQQNLTTLGGQSLSHHIQCIDSISGCGNVLYRMRLEPATGVLSDFLLFGAVSDKQPPDQIPILRDTRARFSAVLAANPPQVIVVTSHLHIDGPDNFQKLARWPAFSNFLATRYTLQTQWSPTRPARWWSREETPASYRIYVLHTQP